MFENRIAKSGRKIALNIVVLPTLAEKPAADPVFFLSGGPGQGATQEAHDGGGRLGQVLRQERDLVYFDQRGTGDSNPLQCDLSNSNSGVQKYFDEMFPIDKVRVCRTKLEKIANLRLYTTPIAIGDLDEVRDAFGYQKINLYGGSYGTLAALEYLRQYPEHVRSMVLAGVATPALKLPLSFARSAQLAMDRLIEDCAADESCNQAIPNLKAEFGQILAQLDNGPVSFTLKDPISKAPQNIAMSRGLFVERLRLMLYDFGAASYVPLLIHHAAQHDWAPFATAVTIMNAPGANNNIATGMYLTVTCSESTARITEPEISRETKGAFMGEYRIRTHLRACMEWPRGKIPAAYYKPVKADAPVLMFSGEIDPATPPQFGAAAGRYLPNSRQVLIPNGTHSYGSECFRSLVAEFFKSGSAMGLNTSCENTVRRPPFVTSFTARP